MSSIHDPRNCALCGRVLIERTESGPRRYDPISGNHIHLRERVCPKRGRFLGHKHSLYIALSQGDEWFAVAYLRWLNG